MSNELFRVTVDEPNYSNVLSNPLDSDQLATVREWIPANEDIRLWGDKY